MRTRGIRLAAAAVAAAVLAGAVATAVVEFGLFEEARNRALDRYAVRGDASDRLVVLGLDAAFLRQAEADPFGQFNVLIRSVQDAGSRAVLVETDALETAQLILAAEPLPGLTTNEAITITFEALPDVLLAVVPGELSAPRDSADLPVLTRAIPRVPYAEEAGSTGFATPLPRDPRHPERGIPLLAEYPVPAGEPVVLPSMPLLAAMAVSDAGSHIELSDDEARVGSTSIPLEGGGGLRVTYTDDLLPGGVNVVQATDLVADRVNESRLRDRVVIAGVTDPGNARLFPAPVGGAGRLPVALVDANAANTIVTGRFTAPPDRALAVLLAAIAAALVTLGVLVLPLWLSPLPPLAVGAGVWFLAASRGGNGDPFDVTIVLGACALAFLVVTLGKGAAAVRDRRRTAALFAVYVPDSVAHELLEQQGAQAAAAGARLDVVTLFCDVRGFTPIAATCAPGEVRRFLDRYYEHTTRIIFDHGGTVLQFTGDEVFAVWGAPLPSPSSVDDALAVTREMLRSAPDLRRRLFEAGLPEIRFGIGLHVGPVVAAHVGTSRRRQYTVLGDTVNVGSRLCGRAGADEALLSEAMWRAAAEPADAQRLEPIELKGVAEPMVVYRLPAPRTGEVLTAPTPP